MWAITYQYMLSFYTFSPFSVGVLGEYTKRRKIKHIYINNAQQEKLLDPLSLF
jgi:hypothetical protein